MLRRAVRARRDGLGRRLRRADEPARRAQLLRARAPRRRAGGVPLDQPRLSGRPAARAAALREEPRRASRSSPTSRCAGASEHGIAEDFPLAGARTLYGATKLAAELLLTEYADAFGIRATIDRCGVIAGPWQMGKVDQGVFTHWLLAHYQRPAADLHRLRRHRQAGARRAARRRRLRARARAARRPRRLGRRDGQRRRRRGGLAVAARDDRPVRRADRQRGADRAGRAGAAGRRAAVRHRTAGGCSSARTGGPRARRATVLEDTLGWIEANERDVLAALG